MKNLMIDLETMGTNSYSAIVSIAAVGFDLETGQKGPEFYRNVNLDSCLKNGLRVKGSTVMWWMNQSQQARESLSNPLPQDLETVLMSFSDWVKTNYQADELLMWGNSARFDLGLLHNAYEVFSMEIPWKFWNERCVRTLVSFRPDIKNDYIHDGVDHNALSDCHKQIGYCSMIWNELKKNT